MQFSPQFKRNIQRIIPFGLFWFASGIFYSLLERALLGEIDYYPATGNLYSFKTNLITASLGALIAGILHGFAELFFMHRLFLRRTFWEKVLVKTLLYVIAIIIFLISLTFFANSLQMDRPLFDPEVLKSVWIFIENFAFWILVLYVGVTIGFLLFFSEISDHLGRDVLKNFFIGKYHEPIEENRIFMFLDMKSSTTIAEQLGHVQYFKLLKAYYADMTDAIIQYEGEVYQYVGDEIIISWKVKNKESNDNCLRCFFALKKSFKVLANTYKERYGLVPSFKAGVHFGKVTTGEIGVVKKNIMFTGDVLNTTARIQACCNDYKTDILISGELLAQLKPEDNYQVIEIGETILRGRDTKVELFTLKEKV